MSGAVFVGTLQLQHDLAGAVTLEPFVGDGRPGDVTAELLEFFTLIGTPAQPRMEAKAVRVDPSSGLDGLALLGRLSKLPAACQPIKSLHHVIDDAQRTERT